MECYFSWEGANLRTPQRIDSPPSAFSAIVFTLGNPHSAVDAQDCKTQIPHSFISGQATRNYQLEIQGNFTQFGIVFRPTAIYQLFGISAFELTDQRFDLHDLDLPIFDHIEEKLAACRPISAGIDIIEQALMKALPSKISWDGVDFAGAEIIASNGNVKIPELLAKSFMSRRKFERHFLKRVGLSPKYYARIRRYGIVCSMMAGRRKIKWDELLHKVGYYDQSHFIKDFKEFSGSSPTQYLATNQELAHLLPADADLI